MTGLIERLRALATRRETPCGAGTMVWHVWGESRPGLPPVVLFHGGSGSWTHWLRNIQPLVAAGRQVIAADLPGFGDSAPPPTGGDADALVAPALARRLVLVGAPAMGVTPDRQFELKAWRHLPSAAEQEAVHRFNLAALMLNDASLIDGLALELHIANLMRDRMPRRRLAHTDILARSLPRVRCPVFAIYGAHDALYKAWIHQLEDAFEAAAPDFRGLVLIPEADGARDGTPADGRAARGVR